jgi:RimJ/RimL family protein N-acetyltransferase
MQNDPRRIQGYSLCLRLVTIEDAAYIHGLRIDPAYNTHLSAVTGTVEGQRKWIEDYKSREAAEREYYYVIERSDNIRCGVVRLYNLEADSFTWGSWILDHNKPAKAALESAFLVYKTAFQVLMLNRAVFEVRRENAHTIAFPRRFGATETGADSENLYFEYGRDRFMRDRDGYIEILKAGK